MGIKRDLLYEEQVAANKPRAVQIRYSSTGIQLFKANMQ